MRKNPCVVSNSIKVQTASFAQVRVQNRVEYERHFVPAGMMKLRLCHLGGLAEELGRARPAGANRTGCGGWKAPPRMPQAGRCYLNVSG